MLQNARVTAFTVSELLKIVRNHCLMENRFLLTLVFSNAMELDLAAEAGDVAAFKGGMTVSGWSWKQY